MRFLNLICTFVIVKVTMKIRIRRKKRKNPALRVSSLKNKVGKQVNRYVKTKCGHPADRIKL